MRKLNAFSAIVIASVLTLQAVHAQTPISAPENGLIAWYPLNGNAADSSGNGNNLSSIGEIVWTEVSDGNSFLDLQGQGDFLYHDDFAFPLEGTDEFSIAFWLRNDAMSTSNGVGGVRPILSKNYSSQIGSFIFYPRTNETAFGYQLDVPIILNLGEWHHLAVVWDSLYTKVFFDGEIVFDGESDVPTPTTFPFMVGGWLTGGLFEDPFVTEGLTFDGGIHSLGLWNRALQEEEIQTLSSSNYACSNTDSCDLGGIPPDESTSCQLSESIMIPDTVSFCDSAVVSIGDGYGLVSWSNGDTSSTVVIEESLVLELTVTNEQSCLSDLGYVELHSSDSTTFWLSPNPGDWATADDVAQANGAHLATFSSPEEMASVCTAADGVHALIGLYQSENNENFSEPSGGWEWVTGEPITWEAWDSGQPNNTSQGFDSEEVGHLRPNCTWNDLPAEYDNYLFILETPASSCICTYTADIVFIQNPQGCTDPFACNYNPDAVCDDGSCIYPVFNNDCEAGAAACGDGQVWIVETQECLTISLFDSDFDGCVTGSDLLDFLSAFGYCLDSEND